MKTIVKLCKLVSIALSFSFLLWSCEKDEIVLPAGLSTEILEAKAYFEKTIDVDEPVPTDNDKLVLKKPNWEKAVFLDDDASIIEVPLTYFSFSENLHLARGGTKQDGLQELHSKNTVKKLILLKSEDGGYDIQVQVIAPDADNATPINNDITFKQLKNNAFKGTLFYFNWYEEYLYGEAYGKSNNASVKNDDDKELIGKRPGRSLGPNDRRAPHGYICVRIKMQVKTGKTSRLTGWSSYLTNGRYKILGSYRTISVEKCLYFMGRWVYNVPRKKVKKPRRYPRGGSYSSSTNKALAKKILIISYIANLKKFAFPKAGIRRLDRIKKSLLNAPMRSYKTIIHNMLWFTRKNQNLPEHIKLKLVTQYVEGQVELENLTAPGKRRWKAKRGHLPNRPNLTYTHSDSESDKGRAYFKMTDGSIVATSGEPLRITSTGLKSFRDNANEDFGEYYYIKIPGMAWAEMFYNSKSTAVKDFEAFFKLGARVIGRQVALQVLPIDEVKILLTGKDLEGLAASRWKAAGMILLSVVPAGKGAKVFKFADKVADGSKLLVKVGTKTVTLNFKVVNGIITFGSRGQLAKIIGKIAGYEVHHIIPWALRENGIIQKAAKAGFHMSAKINGIHLKKFRKLIGQGLHGNHPAYNKFVSFRLNTFKGSTPEASKEFLEKELIPDLLNYIEAAKKSGLNLNEYFRRVINPKLGIR